MSRLLDFEQKSGSDWGPPLQLAPFRELEAQMSRFEAEHGMLIAEIRKNYVMLADSTVPDFLRGHRRIPQLLMDALPHLRRFFADTVFELQVTCDEGGWQMLYVKAMWPGEPRDALAALDDFDDAWWIANSYAAGMALTFTYTLV